MTFCNFDPETCDEVPEFQRSLLILKISQEVTNSFSLPFFPEHYCSPFGRVNLPVTGDLREGTEDKSPTLGSMVRPVLRGT